MRSVIIDEDKIDVCGICGAGDPFIEHKRLEGEHFIWCNKCNTITFLKKPTSEEKQHRIEKEMNFYSNKTK